MSKAPSSILILGIDPGSIRTGFGLIELKNESVCHLNHGVILLSDEKDFAHRLRALSESLQSIVAKAQPHYVVIEKIFLGKSAQSAFQLGHARGVVLAEAARCDAQICEYATRVVKKGITGHDRLYVFELIATVIIHFKLGLICVTNFD